MQNSNFGLKPEDYLLIIAEIKKFAEIKKVIVFGSRAKGNYKPGSDIDLAVIMDPINPDTIGKLKWIFDEELPLPYMFDLVVYDDNLNPNLKEHIDRIGLIFYEKQI